MNNSRFRYINFTYADLVEFQMGIKPFYDEKLRPLQAVRTKFAASGPLESRVKSSHQFGRTRL